MSAEQEAALAAISRALTRLDEREGVGIPAIDDALPYLQPPVTWPEGVPLMRDNPDRWQTAARLSFLSVMTYLLCEKPDALEKSERRKVPTQQAVQLIRESAALLEDADSPLLATLLYSIAEHAKAARYGAVYPLNTCEGYVMTCEFTPDMIDNQKLLDEHTRRGVLLNVRHEPDALTGQYAGKTNKANDADVVKAIAQNFPDSQEFLSASEGYSIIARLAVLCELTGKAAQSNPNESVRSFLKKGHT
jgi:hypothetical protein